MLFSLSLSLSFSSSLFLSSFSSFFPDGKQAEAQNANNARALGKQISHHGPVKTSVQQHIYLETICLRLILSTNFDRMPGQSLLAEEGRREGRERETTLRECQRRLICKRACRHEWLMGQQVAKNVGADAVECLRTPPCARRGPVGHLEPSAFWAALVRRGIYVARRLGLCPTLVQAASSLTSMLRPCWAYVGLYLRKRPRTRTHNAEAPQTQVFGSSGVVLHFCLEFYSYKRP